MALSLAGNMSNVDPQTLLLLSQQLADMANASLAQGGGHTGGPPIISPTGLPPGPHTGTFDREKGKFGFILQDSGEDDMFVLPGACKSFGEIFPPKGTRVTYDTVPDPKSGKLKAENVQPEGGALAQAAVEPMSTTHSGVFDRERGNYGFIKQDNGEDDMFVLPGACKAFGERFPPKGTRVGYNIVSDSRSGKVKAEDLQLEGGVLGGMSSGAMALVQKALTAGGNSGGGARGGYQQPLLAPNIQKQSTSQVYTGLFDRERGTFGFIKQDNGLEDMFVLPGCCEAFGGVFPPIGARLMYTVNYDTKNGKPIAENVQPESGSHFGATIQAANQAAFNFKAPTSAQLAIYPPESIYSGSFDRERGSFGFIKQDGGQDDMFVLPGCCEAFGGAFPAVGTRVTYTVNLDTKNGKPIAENVAPEDEDPYVPSFKARGPSSRYMPYA